MNKIFFALFKNCFLNSISSLKLSIRHKFVYNAAVLKAPSEKLGFTQNEIQVPLENGELLVKVAYCTLNFTDISMFDREEYLPKLPFIPGYEFSGEVAATTSLGKHKVGDRVVCLSRRRTYGGMANYCIVCADDAWVVPYTVPLLCAAVLPYAAPTALMVFAKYASDLSPESTVLISVGPDGLGLQCVEMACSVFKLKVVAVCSTEDRGQVAREAGAYRVITTYVPAFPKDMLFSLPEDIKIWRRSEPDSSFVKWLKETKLAVFLKKYVMDDDFITLKEQRLAVIADILDAVGGKTGASLLVDSVGKEMLCLLSGFVKRKGKIVTLYPFYDPKTIDDVYLKIKRSDEEREREKRVKLEKKFRRKLIVKLKELGNKYLPKTDVEERSDETDNRPLSEKVMFFDIHKYRVLNTINYRILMDDVFSLYENDLITGHVTGKFLLHEINDAIEFISTNKSAGKVVIEMNNPPSEEFGVRGDFTLEDQYNEQQRKEQQQKENVQETKRNENIRERRTEQDRKMLEKAIKVEEEHIKEQEKNEAKMWREAEAKERNGTKDGTEENK